MPAWNVLRVLLCGGALVGSLSTAGCGSGATLADPTDRATPPPAVASTTTVTSTPVSVADAPSSSASVPAGAAQSDVARLFCDLARAMAPLPVYGLEQLPSQASLPAQWWPVLSADSPSAYQGPVVPNPRVSDSPPGSQEAQVVLELGDGWLLILENFRGDLGDVTGCPVGTVAGRPATLYDLDGGFLVQWSNQGLWYGVFGRGVGAETVVEAADALALFPPGH